MDHRLFRADLLVRLQNLYHNDWTLRLIVALISIPLVSRPDTILPKAANLSALVLIALKIALSDRQFNRGGGDNQGLSVSSLE